MSDINKIILVGRLGADPESRPTQTGTPRVTFRLATSTGYGESKTTDWHSIKVFSKSADACLRYLAKGSLCMVEGRVSYREHEGKWYTEIIADQVHFIGSAPEKKQAAHDSPVPMPF